MYGKKKNVGVMVLVGLVRTAQVIFEAGRAVGTHPEEARAAKKAGSWFVEKLRGMKK